MLSHKLNGQYQMSTLYDTKIELNNVEYGICGIDVGNSRVKIHHDNVELSFPYDKEWKKNVQHHFRDHTTQKYLIGLSSVNPKHTTAIVKVLQRILGHKTLNVHSLLMRNQGLLQFGNVESAGIDRLLGTIGAMQVAPPPLITVDCGTAITINAVSSEKVFLGGVIFAGMSTQIFGLSKQTAAIALIPMEEPEGTSGINTKESLLSGVVSSAIGSILYTVENFQKAFFGGEKVPIVLTGGESRFVQRGLEAKGLTVREDSNIVTDGILRLLADAKISDLQDTVIAKI
ncbi:MAG: type III pantothenate kinase [Ignavibacteria bacterium]|nr:type III pantothenate kinase [Ignavibacteria bacterium]